MTHMGRSREGQYNSHMKERIRKVLRQLPPRTIIGSARCEYLDTVKQSNDIKKVKWSKVSADTSRVMRRNTGWSLLDEALRCKVIGVFLWEMFDWSSIIVIAVFSLQSALLSALWSRRLEIQPFREVEVRALPLSHAS